MLNSPRLFKDVCTQWSATADGKGGFTFAAPVLLNCNWSDKQERMTSKTGEDFISRSIVYIQDTDIVIGDYLAQGDYVTPPSPNPVLDPTSLVNKAFRVKDYSRTNDIRNIEVLRKAVL